MIHDIPRKHAMPTIHVHFLPRLTTPETLAGATVVVIDVLRATTTITTALAAGAAPVIPCGELDDARRIREEFAAQRLSIAALLGGERGGLPIEGFDLGNSPAEYTPARVEGRTIAFTTTNGTQAMLHCRQASQVLLGAFVNLQAVVARVRNAENLHIVCAGTQGEITREDVLAAGAIVHRLMLPDDPHAAGAWSRVELNDQARLARDAWQAALPPAELLRSNAPPQWLAKTLAETKGGRNLTRVGLAQDIADCAALDRYPIVPELDISRWQIRACESS
jgi:2-phosphosulfolactate phosphatase